MKKLNLLITALVGTCLAANAQVGTYPGCPGAFGPTKLVQGTTRTNTTPTINTGGKVTWSKDTIYIVKGIVRVGSGTTLELPAGTIVMGFPGPLDTSAIVINMGAKLNVLGAFNNPVVMTSCKIQGARNRGDWGGLIICGKGVSNLGVNQVLEGNYGAVYGGTDPEDNSGSINYLRVEFAGFAFEPNRELNGITLGAVGAKTVFRGVQVSNSADDSFEWFGGSVNGRFLIAYKGLDDDFDSDNGYNGINQFGLSVRDFTVADVSGSNCFESDNEANGDLAGPVLLPKTSAIFSNFTTYGPLFRPGTKQNKFFKTGAIIRRNSEIDIYNSVFAGWPADTTVSDGVQGGKECGGIFISGAKCAANAAVDSIRAKKNVVLLHPAYTKRSPATDNVGTFNAKAWFRAAANANVDTTLIGFYMPFTVSDNNPTYRIAATSPLVGGSSFPAGGVSALNSDLKIGVLHSNTPSARGFFNVAFRGSHEATAANGYHLWDEDWAEYNPNSFKYTAGIVPTRKGAIESFLAGNGSEVANSVVIAPNPAVLNTEIRFLLENATTDAKLNVLDMAGNLVHTEDIFGGVNNVNLNTSNLEPGIYIVRVMANGTVAKTAKLNVVR